MRHDPCPALDKLPDFICSLNGPILVTAPHSITLPPLHRKTHYRERGTGQLAIGIAQRLCSTGNRSSLMVWNCMADSDDCRLDPNYLPTKNFLESEWHRSIHAWVLRWSTLGAPLLHIDLHGKITDELFVDVGMAALERTWPQELQCMVRMLKCQLVKELDDVLAHFQAHGAMGALISAQMDPRLDGYRNDGFATMSMQTAQFGVLSIQLEFPSVLRNRLLVDEELRDALADAIAKVYQNSLVPIWSTIQNGANGTSSLETHKQVLHSEESIYNSGIPSSTNNIAREETETCFIDETFLMLSGMVESLKASEYGQEVDDEGAATCPFLLPCDFGPVQESGPVAPSDMSEWCVSLLQSFRQWEKSHEHLQSI
eukprot:gnl/MRDRNA2_/MRDRNA2_124891_c0_seq1.p1 gnl/MRDRNA2_/MRDRNA2_124891_c0~~gnl/MRDRNA2_/MRDRNA2_124891_c0_seq1.p1  ORF type:complete len:371 (-),score=52.43 gnl/MRDRNA2_/MRDRNA2_124891_c0_seq1:26-1138(-)